MFGGRISSGAYVSLVLHAEIKRVSRSVVHPSFAVSVSSNGPPKSADKLPVKLEGALKWDMVIEQKTVELGRYLAGRTDRLDFSEPPSKLATVDSWELRKRILSLSQSEARRLGIRKSTLHYLRKKARGDRSFSVYKNVRKKLKSGKNVLTTPP